MRKAFLKVGPELVIRYSKAFNCTHEQLKRTARDLDVCSDVTNYLCCCFLTKEELKEVKLRSSSTDWNKIEKEMDEIAKEVSSISWSSSFYESNIGYPVD